TRRHRAAHATRTETTPHSQTMPTIVPSSAIRGAAVGTGVNGMTSGSCEPASFITRTISVSTIFTGAVGPNAAPRAVNAATGTRNLTDAANQSACRIAA